MKIYIPFVNKSGDVKNIMEMFTVMPFVNDERMPQWIHEGNGYHNYGRFDKLLLHKPCHERVVAIEQCDFVVLPFKFNHEDPRVEQVCLAAESNHKKVVAFFCDDDGTIFSVPKNLILFRTSLTKRLKQHYERSMPVLIPDHCPGTIWLGDRLLTHGEDEQVLTYCGHRQHGRAGVMDHLKRVWPETNFLFRSGFWAPEKSKLTARREYYDNMLSGSYCVCMRGCGNFSYRLYEALSFGRVPILIDTDCVLPFEESGVIKWSQHILRITKDELLDMEESDLRHLLNDNGHISPLNNREMWQQYLSPEGYFKNFYKDI